MKQKAYLLVVVLAILCAMGWTGYSQQKRESRTTWEFTNAVSVKEANELGAQGWDLVTVNSEAHDGNGNGIPVFYLKRAK
jgi:hypothetical protein